MSRSGLVDPAWRHEFLTCAVVSPLQSDARVRYPRCNTASSSLDACNLPKSADVQLHENLARLRAITTTSTYGRCMAAVLPCAVLRTHKRNSTLPCPSTPTPLSTAACGLENSIYKGPYVNREDLLLVFSYFFLFFFLSSVSDLKCSCIL